MARFGLWIAVAATLSLWAAPPPALAANCCDISGGTCSGDWDQATCELELLGTWEPTLTCVDTAMPCQGAAPSVPMMSPAGLITLGAFLLAGSALLARRRIRSRDG